MASIPSGTLPGAAVSAIVLAQSVADTAARLDLPQAKALSVARACRAIAVVRAPRIVRQADVAAIAADLIVALQAVREAAPADAAPALYALAAEAAQAYPVTASPVLTRQYRLARALAAGIELAALGEAFLAEARSDFPDRPAAEQARGRIAAALDGAGDRLARRLGLEAAEALSAIARETTTHLVQKAVTLRPVVRVSSPRSSPSTALAWALYGDPTRAPELLARNRCGTPLFMPASIEAASPGR